MGPFKSVLLILLSLSMFLHFFCIWPWRKPWQTQTNKHFQQSMGTFRSCVIYFYFLAYLFIVVVLYLLYIYIFFFFTLSFFFKHHVRACRGFVKIRWKRGAGKIDKLETYKSTQKPPESCFFWPVVQPLYSWFMCSLHWLNMSVFVFSLLVPTMARFPLDQTCCTPNCSETL